MLYGIWKVFLREFNVYKLWYRSTYLYWYLHLIYWINNHQLNSLQVEFFVNTTDAAGVNNIIRWEMLGEYIFPVSNPREDGKRDVSEIE